jgi:DNA-binding NarL/FixJ family response regulator
VIFETSRTTETGVKQFPIGMAVPAGSCSLLRTSRKTECDAKSGRKNGILISIRLPKRIAENPLPEEAEVMSDSKRPRVLLADDHALVAAGISKLLEAEFDLVGTVADGRALVTAAQNDQPDVVLLDISMPNLNGLEAARQIHMIAPDCKLVFVTVHSDAAYVAEAFRAGASGYVLKRSAASELATAVREVLNQRMYLTPLIASAALEGFLNGPDREPGLLSGRQREVLQLVAEGYSAKEIASILKISSKTVEFHKGLVMKKLDLHSTAELTRYALEHGITGN